MSFVTTMSNSLDDMDAKWQFVMTKLFNTLAKVLPSVMSILTTSVTNIYMWPMLNVYILFAYFD